jgi:hypothetical protein
VIDLLLWKASRAASLASRGAWRIHRYLFVAQPVPAARLLAPGTSATTIRRVDAGDPLVAQFPRPPEVIAARYRMGALCFAIENQGRFVGFAWIKEAQYPEDEVRCLYRFEPGTASVWDFDVYIEPRFRFGRTFARLWDYVNAWLREHGYRWSLSRISAFNPDSLAAHRRLGTRIIGTATFIRMGSLQIALIGQAPFVHIGWHDNQVPSLRLRPPGDEPPR